MFMDRPARTGDNSFHGSCREGVRLDQLGEVVRNIFSRSPNRAMKEILSELRASLAVTEREVVLQQRGLLVRESVGNELG